MESEEELGHSGNYCIPPMFACCTCIPNSMLTGGAVGKEPYSTRSTWPGLPLMYAVGKLKVTREVRPFESWGQMASCFFRLH